jgi:hypothetical protein
VRDAAEAGAVEAVACLRRIVRDLKAPAAAAVLACREVLDRAYGRALPEGGAAAPVLAAGGPELDRVTLRLRLEALFESRCVVVDEREELEGGAYQLVSRFRMPDGRVLLFGAYCDERDAWVAPILVGLFGPAASPVAGAVLIEARPPEDRFDLAPVDDGAADDGGPAVDR